MNSFSYAFHYRQYSYFPICLFSLLHNYLSLLLLAPTPNAIQTIT